MAPAAWHRTERYANNRLEADHGQLKRRLRPMRGLKTDLGARVVVAGHAFVRNIRRGHYELAGADDPAGADNAIRPGPGRFDRDERILPCRHSRAIGSPPVTGR
jgi:hypothetical protein